MHEQAADPARFAQRAQQLDRGQSHAGQAVGVDAPDPGDVCASNGIVDPAVAGQLVAFLPVLATALSVALAGEGAVAGVSGADEAEHEAEVDRGGGRVGAVGVLFHAAPGENVGAAAGRRSPCGAGGEAASQLPQLPDRNAGLFLHPSWPPLTDATTHSVEPGSAFGEVVEIDEILGDDDVGEAEQKHEVAARGGLHVQSHATIGEPRGGGVPGVDDHEAAGGSGSLQVPDERRHGLRHVGSENQNGVGRVELLDRERQPPVEAEGPVAGRRGARHAESAVVVDAAGAKRHPGEFSELVGLLVGEAASAEDADRVGPELGTGLAQLGRDQVECVTPGGRLEGSIRLPQQRFEDAVGRHEQLGRGPAFLAQTATIGRECSAGHQQ